MQMVVAVYISLDARVFFSKLLQLLGYLSGVPYTFNMWILHPICDFCVDSPYSLMLK